MRFRATSRSTASLHDPRERSWRFMYPRPHRAVCRGTALGSAGTPPRRIRTAGGAAGRPISAPHLQRHRGRFGQHGCPAERGGSGPTRRSRGLAPGSAAPPAPRQGGLPGTDRTSRAPRPRRLSAAGPQQGFTPALAPPRRAHVRRAGGRPLSSFLAARCPAAAPTLALRVHLPQQRGVALDVQRQRFHALQVVLHIEGEQPGPLPARRRRPRHQLWPRQHHPPAPAAHPPPPRRPHRARGPCGSPAPFSVFFFFFSSCRRPVALGRPHPGDGERSPGWAGPGRAGADTPPRGPAGRAPLPAVPLPELNPCSAPPPLLAARMREALPL